MRPRGGELLAGALALALVATLGLAACGDQGTAATGSGLVVELVPEGAITGVIVYVDDPERNTLAATDGERSVVLTCMTHDGDAVVESRQPWPFTDTDDGKLAPHVHERVDSAAGRIVSCRLDGTEGPLAGAPELAR